MTYNILFLDIDGTILKPDHTYTASTKDAISQLQQQGIEVFLATGRPLHEINDLAKELNVHSLIGYNGAFAIYQDKTIVDEPMDSDTVKQFLEIAKGNGHEMVLYTSEKNYFTSLDKPIVNKFIETFQMKHNELFRNEVSGEILGATIMNVNEDQAALYQLEANIHLSQVNIAGVENSYDVIRKNVNKGTAIKQLRELLDIPKAGTIAFGDGMNDKEMLQSVGEGFAMENAHPDLFAYAKHTTTSVSESGIFNGLKQLGLVK